VNELVARLSAIAYALILLAAGAALYLTSQPGLRGGTEVHAEFQDVYPLLTGMDVREWGGPAGSVSAIQLTDHGTVMVTLQLNGGTTPPSSDASVSIREQDITGDSYVDLSPGHSKQPLGDAVIPTSRTIVAPRFDDLLNSFDRPVQQSLQILLDQLGMAVQGRGEDVNRAVLALRPALSATDTALREVNSQNHTLRRLIGDTENITGQAASGSRELGSLVDSLARITRTTAVHSQGLDAGLQVAPQTLRRARRTLGELTGLAKAGLPAARTLRSAAPQLAQTAELLGPFLDDASAVLTDISPTLDATRRLFTASEPTLAASPKHVLTAPFDVASGTSRLLTTLVGQKDVIHSLFGAEGYGRPPKNKGAAGLGAVGVERGNQQFYPPNYDRKRFFLRASTVLSCETFGLPIAPGCLAAIAGGAGAPSPSPAAPQPSNPSKPATPNSPGGTPPAPSAGSSDGAQGGLLGGATGILHRLGDTARKPKPPASSGALNDLLHVLLGP
jgi:phospholipid/cholesterol/gamma-HCH transport system substrate-binding protein